MKYLRPLTPVHWTWIHAKIAIGVWAVLLFIFTPEKVLGALGTWLTGSVTAITLIGVIVSICGLVMSVQPQRRRALLGLTVELVGLAWAIGGVAAYFLTQLLLAASLPDGDQRIALTGFAYAMVALLVCRVALVGARRQKETR